MKNLNFIIGAIAFVGLFFFIIKKEPFKKRKLASKAKKVNSDSSSDQSSADQSTNLGKYTSANGWQPANISMLGDAENYVCEISERNSKFYCKRK